MPPGPNVLLGRAWATGARAARLYRSGPCRRRARFAVSRCVFSFAIRESAPCPCRRGLTPWNRSTGSTVSRDAYALSHLSSRRDFAKERSTATFFRSIAARGVTASSARRRKLAGSLQLFYAHGLRVCSRPHTFVTPKRQASPERQPSISGKSRSPRKRALSASHRQTHKTPPTATRVCVTNLGGGREKIKPRSPQSLIRKHNPRSPAT